MDEQIEQSARQRSGVVRADDLGSQPRRAAGRHGLREVHPGAFVAGTQPVDVVVLLEAMRQSRGDRDWVVMADAALWLYEVAPMPERLDIGVRLGHKLLASPPVKVRRVADVVHVGSRPMKRCRVVALEIAVVQVGKTWTGAAVQQLVEDLVRGRRTTIARLRARCRRGLAGSAALRAVCDVLAGGSMEKDVRSLKAALEALGVTGLEVEVRFTNEAGASAYADLLHRPTMTVLEVDGLVEHTRRQRFQADRRRDRWMRREHEAPTLRVDVLEIREDLAALAVELAWFLLPGPDAVAAG